MDHQVITITIITTIITTTIDRINDELRNNFFDKNLFDNNSYEICVKILNDIFEFYINGYPDIHEEYLYPGKV